VRIDSGDFLGLSRAVRRILDDAGLRDAKIVASGDLDEDRIAAIVEAGAPVDAFGVGTELATSADAPSMGAIYKLVEIESGGKTRFTAKDSVEKHTLPGAKQLFRYPEYDLLALHHECACGAEAMLKPVVIGGHLVEELPSVETIRARAQAGLASWPAPARRTQLSPALEDLAAEVRGTRTQP
jgi:nicotinate phosphoribosyltransferase